MSGLEAAFRLRQDDFELNVELRAPKRGITAVFGPSGSGKTTLLRCLAGLSRAPEGRVRLGDEVWQDERAGVFEPPHRRALGYVFQEADLFPHLDVRGNLAYGRRRRGGDDATLAWDDVVEWLGVGRLLERSPAGLSGGERQRVAIARSLLAGPRLLLLDEPLSALDEPARRAIFPYLEGLRSRLSIPILYVSHSLREVARLADRLVWLVDGRVRAAGSVQEVVGRMDFARWRGESAGVVVEATVSEHREGFHLTRLSGPWGDIWTRRQEAAVGDRVRLEVLASDVGLALAPERDSSVLNEFRLVVRRVQAAAPGEVLVRLEPGTGPAVPLLARITALSAERLEIGPGKELFARVKSVAVVD